MPLAQLVSVFGFLFGYLFLKETILKSELWAAAMILLSGLILTSASNEGNYRIKYRLILYMIGATLCYALGAVLYKFAVIV
jgi:drug/metabolite transporter (DMT)-like permease